MKFYLAFLTLTKKYTITPTAAIKLPNNAYHPVEIKRNNQIQIETTTGNGNSNILKGRSFLPNLLLNSATPIPWAIN